MDEQIYFADTSVTITSTEATFGARRYAIGDIASARYSIESASKPRLWYALTYASLGASILGLVLIITKTILDLSDPPNTTFKYILIAGSTVMFLASPLLLATRESFTKVRYLVTISGSFGKVDVVLARNEKYAQRVTKAINKALKDGRKSTQSQLRMT